MSSHLRAEDHPTTRVIPEPSQRSRAGRLPPPRGDPAAEHYSHPIFWREPSFGAPGHATVECMGAGMAGRDTSAAAAEEDRAP